MMPDMRPPFADLHNAIMAVTRHDFHSGSDAHDDYTCALLLYQHNANNTRHLAQLVTLCERRAGQHGLPLDLVAAYTALAALARWRADQLSRGIVAIPGGTHADREKNPAARGRPDTSSTTARS